MLRFTNYVVDHEKINNLVLDNALYDSVKDVCLVYWTVNMEVINRFNKRNTTSGM